MAALYLHIPFCESKCAYCDFYSMPVGNKSLDAYVDALERELSMRRGEVDEEFDTIYIGGGTPSILPPVSFSHLAKILNNVAPKAVEFTIEVNPDHVSPSLIDAYIKAGVNRISMGVQSFDDRMLKAVNRRHDAATAHSALRLLKDANINFNADLIFGLPGQTLDLWRESLETLLSYRPNHISAYLLSYEPGTRLYAKLMAGKVEEASDELATQMYDALCKAGADAGYEHYEISNFALPGFHSRHNSSYWDGTPYLGLGASAHSFDGMVRRVNPANLNHYLQHINAGKPAFEIEVEDEANRFNDFIITALRTVRGLSLTALESRFSADLFAQFQASLAPLARVGSVIIRGDNVTIPTSQWLTCDAILRKLIVI